jgi:hypothetical protein
MPAPNRDDPLQCHPCAFRRCRAGLGSSITWASVSERREAEESHSHTTPGRTTSRQGCRARPRFLDRGQYGLKLACREFRLVLFQKFRSSAIVRVNLLPSSRIRLGEGLKQTDKQNHAAENTNALCPYGAIVRRTRNASCSSEMHLSERDTSIQLEGAWPDRG